MSLVDRKSPSLLMFRNPQELLEVFADTNLRLIGDGLLPQDRPLGDGQTAAVALACPRTAALCFDRVWSIPIDGTETPEGIAFSGRTQAEAVAALFLAGWSQFGETLMATDHQALADELAGRLADGSLAETIQQGVPAMATQHELVTAYIMTLLGSSLFGGLDGIATPLTNMARILSEELSAALRTGIVPVFASEQGRDAQYTEGATEVIVTTLRNLDVVDEATLEWKQVLDFKNDPVARTDYRRLVHWLDGSLVGQSLTYVQDEIAGRLDKYRATLTKHGLKTRLGVLSSIVEPKTIIPATTAASGFLLADQPLWGLLSAGGLLLSRTLVTAGEARLDLAESLDDQRSIAFVAEIGERLTRSRQ